MGRAWILAVVATVAGCRGLDGAFTCDVSQECVSGGVAGFCEANGSCSFPDPSCESGRRYGSYASSDVRTICVGDEPIPDASPGGADARPDGVNPGPDGGGPRVDAATDPCDRPEPGPTTTGVPTGTSLTSYTGNLRIDVDGSVVEDLDIQGSIAIAANDVTIRRVRLRSGDYFPIQYTSDTFTGLVVEDSEIDLTSDAPVGGIVGGNFTARRLDVHGGSNGLRPASNVLIEDSWIHDVPNGPGIGSVGGTNIVMRHNKIVDNYTGALSFGDYERACRDVVLDCSIVTGGGYTVSIRGAGATTPSGTVITNNVFARDHAYGPLDLSDPSPTVTGNTYTDGAPIPW